MKSSFYAFVMLAVVLVICFSIPSQAHKNHNIGKDEHPSIKARHQLMSSAADAVKIAGKMVKKQSPYDAEKAELAMHVLTLTALTMDKYFSNASKPKHGSKSEASPRIWKEKENFKKEIEKFKSVSQKALSNAGKSEKEFKSGFLSVMKSCKSCHEPFRIKK